jgi:hypothetical protein
MNVKISVIITTYHQKAFTLNCVKSYLYFCPDNIKLNLIVVENSNDQTYKKDVLELGNNIIWINNNTDYRGANANANGVEVGMKYVGEEYVFLSHNDVCITSSMFYNCMAKKIEEGNRLIGTCYDVHPLRHHSIIILGCMVDPKIVRAVDLYPENRPDGTPHFECGDRIHIYCKDNNIKHVCLKNTHNNKEILTNMQELYRSIPYTLRTIDDEGNVIFMHFSRGTPKTNNQYIKRGRWSIPQIMNFCEENIYLRKNNELV